MLWLQSSISTVAHELWYSPWATIRSWCRTWILRDGDWGLAVAPRASSAASCSACSRASRWTAFRSVLAGSRLSVSPNSYGFGAPVVSTPVACPRVAWRPRPARAARVRRPRCGGAPLAALPERPEQVAQRAVAEEVERLVGDFEGDLPLAVA